MSAPDLYPEITARKTFDELTSSPETFVKLVGMLLLFARDSDYYGYSGWCRGAILNPEPCADCGKKGSILALSKGPEATKIEDIEMMRLDRDELEVMLGHCDAFIGVTPEESFLLS